MIKPITASEVCKMASLCPWNPMMGICAEMLRKTAHKPNSPPIVTPQHVRYDGIPAYGVAGSLQRVQFHTTRHSCGGIPAGLLGSGALAGYVTNVAVAVLRTVWLSVDVMFYVAYVPECSDVWYSTVHCINGDQWQGSNDAVPCDRAA